MNKKESKKLNFGEFGAASIETLEMNIQISNLNRDELINSEQTLALRHIKNGAVLGTVTVFTTLLPHEVRAGATGVP